MNTQTRAYTRKYSDEVSKLWNFAVVLLLRRPLEMSRAPARAGVFVCTFCVQVLLSVETTAVLEPGEFFSRNNEVGIK